MEQTPKSTEAPKPKSRTLLYAIVVIVLIVVGVGVYILTLPPATSANVLIQDDSACGAGPPPDAACIFNPASINATVNVAAITWKNNGGVTHTVTTCDSTNGASTAQCPNGPNASGGLDPSFTGNVPKGSTYAHTFAHAGTYYYYCAIHPWMHGTVIAK